MAINYTFALSKILKLFGAEAAFGVTGGYILSQWEALKLTGFQVIDCSHEEGGTFSASENSILTDKITVSFSTAGPGFYHAVPGLRVAKLDGGKIVHFAGITSYEHTGKWELQETTVDNVMAFKNKNDDGIFDEVIIIKNQKDVDRVIDFLKKNHKNPCGFVLGIFMMNPVQRMIYENFEATEKELMAYLADINTASVETSDSDQLDSYARQIAEEFKQGPALIWNGFGTRHASEALTRLAESVQAKVMSTPRGKGVFPESHPLYVGSTGMGSDALAIRKAVRDERLHSMLILGSRLGEFSSSYIQEGFKAGRKYYYVGLQTEKVKNNLPPDTICIQAEIGRFLQMILSHLDPAYPYPGFSKEVKDIQPEVVDTTSRPHPREVMKLIQKIAVEQYHCVIAGEAGNAFAWTSRYLMMDTPNCYRVSTAYGSMAHYACGLVGLAASGRQALGVIGDGSMIMVNEVITGVKYNLPAIWLVLNDGCYNMIRQGLPIVGITPLDSSFPAPDYAGYGRALGADGYTAATLEELEKVLQEACANRRPAVIDVQIDPEPIAPVGERIERLKEMAQQKKEPK